MRDPGRGLTHDAEVASLRRVGDEIARLTSAVGLERSARLVAVALVPVFLLDDTITRFVPVYTALIAYVLATSFSPRNRFLRAADIAVATALIVATGGEVLPFLLFLLVAVAGPAAQAGLLAGLAAGGTLSVVLITTLAAMQRFDELGLAQLMPIGLLLPLAGVTIGAASQVYAADEAQDRRKLQEANRLLSALRAVADDLPGGLDVTTVAGALVAEARGLAESKAVLVYALDAGTLVPVGSGGLSRGKLPTLRVDQLRALSRPGRVRLRSLASLPAELQPACGAHRWWAVTGMYREDELVGCLLVGADDPDAVRVARARMLSLGTDGAIAIQNAQLFDGTRERAAQAARFHIAGDLHDGAAQALAHLRMELELLARTASGNDAGELERLSGVALSALQDLRATIVGLRHPGHDDLAEAINRHIDVVMKQDGPLIEFDPVGDTDVPALVGDELLRVVQEAISNALRHARATRIRVALEVDTELVRLAIEDDGVGLDPGTEHRADGVGIRSMKERAARLDGRLRIGSSASGGTLVELRCPVPVGGEPEGRDGGGSGGAGTPRRRTGPADRRALPRTLPSDDPPRSST